MPINQSYGISAPVGAQPKAVNQRDDVKIIQKLLNEHAQRVGYPKMHETGTVSEPMITAIRKFQKQVVGMRAPDGRVDPSGRTLAKLNQPAAAIPIFPGLGNFDPTGKTFQQRLDAFLADAKATYGITVPAGSEFRKAEDAQKWHVAHMMYFNSYNSLKPAKNETFNGRSVISWSHLSRATLVWQHISWSDFLRDAQGNVPVKNGNAWAAGKEPDKDKSRAQAYAILKAAGIGTPKTPGAKAHSAMVAPGYTGCAEPCKCGGKRSNHISGAASDLGKAQMLQLQNKLIQAKAGTIDNYLKSFGLKRPMKSEPWHVEAT